MTFSFDKEKKNGKIFFLDVELSQESRKFVVTVNRISKGFLLSTLKSGMLHTLVYRCFALCSN